MDRKDQGQIGGDLAEVPERPVQLVDEVAEVQRTPVGDTYVSTRLREWGDFGGEPSGAWIFPGHSLCPDGIYAAALLCEMASEWDIAAELDGIPRYPIVRESRPRKSFKKESMPIRRKDIQRSGSSITKGVRSATRVEITAPTLKRPILSKRIRPSPGIQFRIELMWQITVIPAFR